MTEIELSVSPHYVEWGIWEALRELMQNARDSHEQGFEMSVDYFPRTKAFSLSNSGVTLGRETLVLGGTTKRDDPNQRGQFGEGYKLALATLLREGCHVTIANGGESWIPSISHSETFNTDLLKIRIEPREKNYPGLRFMVTGVTPEQYQELSEKLLFLKVQSPSPVKEGRVLYTPEYQNKLFVKGIFVNEMPEQTKFGYDLNEVMLNRDRTLADPYALKRSIVETISASIKAGVFSIENLFDLLYKPNGEEGFWYEESAFRSYYYLLDGEVTKKLAECFIDKFGERAVPVTQASQVNEAGYFGKTGVYVSPGMAAVLQVTMGTFQALKSRESTSIKNLYPYQELDAEEQHNLLMAVRAVAPHEPVCGLPGIDVENYEGACAISVVDFVGPQILGCFQRTENENTSLHTVRLARRILKDLPELVATLIHEVAHKYGGDGEPDHLAAIESLNGKVVAGLLSALYAR